LVPLHRAVLALPAVVRVLRDADATDRFGDRLALGPERPRPRGAW
jgi:hypothetical protein